MEGEGILIYIQTLDRFWNPGNQLIKKHPTMNLADFQYYICNEFIRLFQLSIDTQRYKSSWGTLSIPYKQYKLSNNLSLNIWEATGQTKSSLKVMYVGHTLTIGFDKRYKHVNSNVRVYQIARWMEFGTYNMQPRPLFRFIYQYISSNINYFFKKYVSEEGITL